MQVLEKDIKNIPETQLSRLESLCSTITFKPGQVVYYKEHLPYGIFFLVKGLAEIKGSRKSEKIEPIKILGLNSFLKNKSYPFTVKALSVCTVKFLSTTAYNDLIKKRDPILEFLS